MSASTRKELTPAQHTLIRQQIALIPLYAWVVFACGVFIVHLPVPPFGAKAHIARDFVHFYAQGVITREHDSHALYDIDAMAAVVERVVPVPVGRFPPVYGPQVGLLFSPLTMLPYTPAMLVWLAMTVVGYAVCMYLVWRSGGASRPFNWAACVLGLGAPGLHFTLSFGQASLVGLICFTALWLALRNGRNFIAGLAIGALAYKPQLGIAAAFVLVFAKEWRMVYGALVSVGAQAAAGWAYWGASIFPAYVRALLKLPGVIGAMEPDKALMHSWRAFFLHLGLSPAVALALTAATSLVTLVVALLCWRTQGDKAPRYVVLVLATLLVDPHMYAYDLMFLMPALLVAWDWGNEQGDARLAELVPAWVPASAARLRISATVTCLVLVVYSAPILTIVLEAIPVQWSVVSFLMLGGLLSRRLLVDWAKLKPTPEISGS